MASSGTLAHSWRSTDCVCVRVTEGWFVLFLFCSRCLMKVTVFCQTLGLINLMCKHSRHWCADTTIQNKELDKHSAQAPVCLFTLSTNETSASRLQSHSYSRSQELFSWTNLSGKSRAFASWLGSPFITMVQNYSYITAAAATKQRSIT